MKRIAAILIAFAFTSPAYADVVLPAVISDHMVLQSGAKATIWGWADAGEEVAVEFAGQVKRATADADGQWQVRLDPLRVSKEGRDLTVKGKNTIVLSDVLVGEVWLAAGQSNMVSGVKQVPQNEKDVFIAEKSNGLVRIFLAGGKNAETPGNDVAGRWILCSEQAMNISAVGFFFALKLQKELDAPAACLVAAACGSQIEPFMTPEEFETLEPSPKRKGSGIYNARLAPLRQYAIKGAIWYQGESNRGTTDYFQCLKALSDGWSKAFGITHIPLYLVQVAPFDYSRKGERSSLLADTVWAAEYRAAKEIPGVGVVPIHDTDVNVKMIHPRRKKPVGERLAALALKNQYGKQVVASGPCFEKAALKDDIVFVRFSGLDQGLRTKDGKQPTCFELSEDGKTFVAAEAKLTGNQVEVRADSLSSPKFIRMGWYDTATPNLQDKNGWPVFIFGNKQIEKE